METCFSCRNQQKSIVPSSFDDDCAFSALEAWRSTLQALDWWFQWAPNAASSLYNPKPIFHPRRLRKHVMISYAWASNKHLVVALTQRLRAAGLDVWRDEDGSALLPKLSGDVEHSLAQAIEASHAVIICVSRAYQESLNCRSEAQMCRHLQSHGLRVIYVMMEMDFTTVSRPHTVSGWLRFLLGGELWYPLWSVESVDATSAQICELLADHPSPVPMPESAAMKSTALVGRGPTSAGIDWDAALMHLQLSGRSAVEEKLTEDDVSDGRALAMLAEHELFEYASMLGKATRRGFLTALRLQDRVAPGVISRTIRK